MLYNKGNHAKLKYVQLQPPPLQGENGGKIYSAWNPGIPFLSQLFTIMSMRSVIGLECTSTLGQITNSYLIQEITLRNQGILLQILIRVARMRFL